MKSTCVEFFGSEREKSGSREDGVCGRPATHASYDACSDTWGPKCPRCAKFYFEGIMPLTKELDDEIAALQAKLQAK